MEVDLHSAADNNVVALRDNKIKPFELGKYILNELNFEEREKILKKVAVDRVVNQLIEKDYNNVVSISENVTKTPANSFKDEMLYYLALCQFKGLTTSSLKKSISHFNSLRDLFQAPVSYLKEKGLPLPIVSNLADEESRDRALDKAYEILRTCNEENIKLLYANHSNYPDFLKNTNSIPPLLFYKGDISFIKRQRKISFFGKKDASEFGVRVANSLSSALSSEGYTLVSNSFSTVGTQSSFISIQNNCPPLVVFPTSLDHSTTKFKRKFINYVVDGGGLVLSMYHPGEKYTYRNIVNSYKLQLLISMAVVMIESDPSLASTQLIANAKTLRKPIIAPVPPKHFRDQNKEIITLIKNDPRILSIYSKDEYYKIFELLQEIEKTMYI